MNKVIVFITTTFLSTLSALFLAPFVAIASDNPIINGTNAMKIDGLPTTIFGVTGIFTVISNSLLFFIGALSVFMLIVGGFRYVISGGKDANVTNAKNTILYAIIGLIIALLSYAIINFVINTFIAGAGFGGTNV